jgi:outer membrane biosynthesis protein TonB
VMSWSNEALVKKTEPQKKVTAIQAADESSAANAGTRNIADPAANRSAIHHTARPGGLIAAGFDPRRPARASEDDAENDEARWSRWCGRYPRRALQGDEA